MTLDPGPALGALVGYALSTGLIRPDDERWAVNQVLEVLRLDSPGSYDGPRHDDGVGPDQLLAPLLSDAAGRGVIDDTPGQRDLLDAAVMGALMARPSAVTADFWRHYGHSPSLATDAFYRLCVDANYVHAARSAANPRWRYPSRYGELDITINLAKPEKDPRDIAAAASGGGTGGAAYPACLLCPANEGYAGRRDHPARQNLRVIALDLAGDDWYLQYSPYLYYLEHCIVLSGEHRPMQLTRTTFARLLDFVGQFPDYFVGSNADLPIVGGSILSHDHFQGGRNEFPIQRARTVMAFEGPAAGLRAQVLDWPLSVLRLTAADPQVLTAAGFALLTAWRDHEVPQTEVKARTGDTPHNTVTPIARRVGRDFQLDVVLRNNRTTPAHPDGLFHPHAEIHPVKKENIGLIEVMGLAVLPGRLAADIPRLAEVVSGAGELAPDLVAHAPMVEELRVDHEGHPSAAPEAAEARVRAAIGEYFTRGLEHCGVLGPASASGPLWTELLAPLGYTPAA